MFAGIWFSLNAYDKGKLFTHGTTKKSFSLTANKVGKALIELKQMLISKGSAEGETRTLTRLPPTDFESAASAIPPPRL